MIGNPSLNHRYRKGFYSLFKTLQQNLVKNIGAGLKNLVGGEIKAYTEMQQEARKIAMDRLKEEAKNIGADAIIAMRFDSGSISNDMQSVVAYGTAVKFKNQ
ncbi:heavy metal-binding domain-containing protein [Enterococcus faecalis]|uniref:heavy metal-binding domain-containing protein n=1 Tax=Enterococcus faecalis TaxID=1351 RepID=UPI003D6B9B91